MESAGPIARAGVLWALGETRIQVRQEVASAGRLLFGCLRTTTTLPVVSAPACTNCGSTDFDFDYVTIEIATTTSFEIHQGKVEGGGSSQHDEEDVRPADVVCA